MMKPVVTRNFVFIKNAYESLEALEKLNAPSEHVFEAMRQLLDGIIHSRHRPTL